MRNGLQNVRVSLKLIDFGPISIQWTLSLPPTTIRKPYGFCDIFRVLRKGALGINGLKNCNSFKNGYTITSMGLFRQNKRFLHLTTGVAGSLHDACLVRRSSLFQQICRGEKTLIKHKV